ncbi:GNAT family N-acetyltransferase [Phycobacter sp. K97]|uniref:GNAT family N-acetyltransferase n=1 Tax=Phycobacter sedimenti TaxID=3133977 RepID=UPI0031202B44
MSVHWGIAPQNPGEAIIFLPTHHAPQSQTQALVFPHYRSLLNQTPDNVIAFAAMRSEAVLGVLIVSVEGQGASILSFAVAQRAQRSGVGRELMDAGLDAAARLGARTAKIEFSTRPENARSLIAFLAATGWTKPTPKVFFSHADPICVLNQTWAERALSRGPRNAGVFDWKDLARSDRDFIAAEIAAGRYPEAVSPFWQEDQMTGISIGLRAGNGRVVGWLVSHFVPSSPGVIRYSRSFSSDAPAFRGNGSWLMAETLNRHANGALYEQYPRVLFDIDYRNRPMMNVFHRRFGPYVEQSYDLCTASKDIAPHAE